MVEYFGHLLLDFMSGWSLISQIALFAVAAAGAVSFATICEYLYSQWWPRCKSQSLASALGNALYRVWQAYEGLFDPPERHQGGGR